MHSGHRTVPSVSPNTEPEAARQTPSGVAFRTLLAGITVAAMCVLIVHWPVLSAQAMAFDDREAVTDNYLIQDPGLDSAKRILGEVLHPSTIKGYYRPLTTLSLMLDWSLGGRPDDLTAFHRTSLILHVLNTALLVVLLYQLFGDPLAAALLGLLFGVHPLTVEPVAWVMERKTLLAAFFAFGGLNLYVGYARRGGGWKAYAGALSMYLLALMSKPTAVPLPLILLVLDYWPLRRLGRRAVLEKLPFVALGVFSAVVTYLSESHVQLLQTPGAHSLAQWPLRVGCLIAFYLGKVVAPYALSPAYAFPDPFSLLMLKVLAGVLVTCASIAGVAVSLRWTRGLFAGAMIFLLGLSPTLGLVGYSWVVASDKYLYLPAIGLMLPAAYGLRVLAKTGITQTGDVGGWHGQAEPYSAELARGGRNHPAPRHGQASTRSTGPALAHATLVSGCTPSRDARRRLGIVALAATAALALSFVTRRQIAHWQDSETLYRYMLTVNPNQALLHSDFANILQQQGRTGEAVEHYTEALRLRPAYPDASVGLGAAWAARGRVDEAIGYYLEALRRDPGHLNAFNDLAWELATHEFSDKSHLPDAVQLAERACGRTGGPRADLLDTLAAAYADAGRFAEAVATARQALDLASSSSQTQLSEEIRGRMQLYQSGRAYRESPPSRPEQ